MMGSRFLTNYLRIYCGLDMKLYSFERDNGPSKVMKLEGTHFDLWARSKIYVGWSPGLILEVVRAQIHLNRRFPKNRVGIPFCYFTKGEAINAQGCRDGKDKRNGHHMNIIPAW